MNFASALALALTGVHVRRAGWRNKFHLELVSAPNALPYLQRTPDDGSAVSPWGRVTADDFFSDDWLADDGQDGSGVTLAEGSTPWAVQQILDGRTVQAVGSPFTASADTDPGNGGSRILRMRLPNGKTPYFELAPVDVVRSWTTAQA